MNHLLLVLAILVPNANAKIVTPKYDAACTLQAVAKRMNVQVRSDIPLPTIMLASEIPFNEFQDIIESEWGMRPEVFTNVFSPKRNIIFLINESDHYMSYRFIEDALAHELVHFVQVAYKGEPNSEELEWEADRIQTWFRETILPSGQSPCAGGDPKIAQLN